MLNLSWEKYARTPHLAIDGNYLLGAVENADGFHWWIVEDGSAEFAARGGTLPTLAEAQGEAEAALSRLKAEGGS